MTDETDNLAEAGTDNIDNSDIDNLDELGSVDPEEQDNDVESDEFETDDEEGEPEEVPEDNPEEGPDEPEEKPEEPAITLRDGTKLTLQEVENGYMRQADYTRKSQEVANVRKAAEETAKYIDGIASSVIDYLAKMLPEEPGIEVAYSNPQEYTQKKAAYDVAVSQLQKLVELGEQAKGEAKAFTDEERATRLQGENQKLNDMFPKQLAENKGRETFFKEVAEVAQEVGFSLDDVKAAEDHRLFALAYWANKGMKAEKAAKTAKQKKQKAAPVAPNKPGSSNGRSAARRNAAMDALLQDDSIENAVRLLSS